MDTAALDQDIGWIGRRDEWHIWQSCSHSSRQEWSQMPVRPMSYVLTNSFPNASLKFNTIYSSVLTGHRPMPRAHGRRFCNSTPLNERPICRCVAVVCASKCEQAARRLSVCLCVTDRQREVIARGHVMCWSLYVTPFNAVLITSRRQLWHTLTHAQTDGQTILSTTSVKPASQPVSCLFVH